MSRSLTSAAAMPPPDADALERASDGRYRVYRDTTAGDRKLRYIAIARTLSVRPYAMVTTDPAELLAALDRFDAAEDATDRPATP